MFVCPWVLLLIQLFGVGSLAPLHSRRCALNTRCRTLGSDRDLCIHSSSSGDGAKKDYIEEFSWFERILFQRFADSVSVELSGSIESSAGTYRDLMSQINRMASSRPLPVVNKQGRNMLVRLFPNWLLPAFRVMFAKPFPTFSAWMNSWVTKWTTRWLMGPAEIRDLERKDGSVGKDQLLVIEKCRFLESTGCARTCLHTCKISTQDFFLEDMAIPVTLKPNFTDFSCRFEFGNAPIPIAEEPDIMMQPCLIDCAQPKGGTGTNCVERNPIVS